MPTDGPSLTADHLAAKISPAIQQKLRDSEDDIVANAGGAMTRIAVRTGFPIAVREVPTLTKHGIELALDEFGQFSLSDLTRLIENHMAMRGAVDSPLLRELRAARGF